MLFVAEGQRQQLLSCWDVISIFVGLILAVKQVDKPPLIVSLQGTYLYPQPLMPDMKQAPTYML